MPTRVIVSSGGVFHSHHLAQAAHQAGVLHRFISGVRLKGEKHIPAEKWETVRIIGYLAQLSSYLPSDVTRAYSYMLIDRLYDQLASRWVTDCDIFHYFNHQGLYSARKAKKFGALTICERCSAHPIEQHAILSAEYQRWGLRYPQAYQQLHERHLQEYAEADYVMVCSDFVRRSMQANGVPAHKVLQTHLGFEPTRFFPAQKEDDVFRVVYAGGISLQKGIPYLLSAFRNLNLPNSELVLVGSPYPEAQVFLKPYAGLYKQVDFVPNAELGKFFQQASVFVFPSLQDGFGMVVYEAAACGIPVIISDHTGADIRDGVDGFVTAVRDVPALQEKLAWLYHHPNERVQMGQNAHQWVQQFTWKHYAQEVRQHYATLHA